MIDKLTHYLRGCKNMFDKSKLTNIDIVDRNDWTIEVKDDKNCYIYFENAFGDKMEQSVATWRFYLKGERVREDEFRKHYEKYLRRRSVR